MARPRCLVLGLSVPFVGIMSLRDGETYLKLYRCNFVKKKILLEKARRRISRLRREDYVRKDVEGLGDGVDWKKLAGIGQR